MKRDRTEWKIDNDVIYDWQQQLWFYKGRKYVICTFNLPKSNQFNWRPAVKWYVALQWTFSVNNIIGNSSNAKNNLPKQVWVSDVQCRYMPRLDIWCGRCAQSGDPDGPTSEERPWSPNSSNPCPITQEPNSPYCSCPDQPLLPLIPLLVVHSDFFPRAHLIAFGDKTLVRPKLIE